MKDTAQRHETVLPSVPSQREAREGGGHLAAQLASSPRQLAQRRVIDQTLGSAVQRVEGELEEEDRGAAQLRAAPLQRQEGGPDEEDDDDATAQLRAEPAERQDNRTGLPDGLKAGIESMSGMDMSGVRVHRNSSQPAQLNALAYAQGSDIHLAPGQEQHLPHEAWHVVQQAQGRVKPTMQTAGGFAVNDDGGLEKEADVMGAKAMSLTVQARQEVTSEASGAAGIAMTAQRTVVPGTAIDVDNSSDMPTWTQDGETYHINTKSSDTYHVTQEGIPKVQFFFTGTGTAIRDKRPSKKEQGGSSTKKVKKKGQKAKKVKTKRVFSELPTDVQNFVKNHWVAIFDA